MKKTGYGGKIISRQLFILLLAIPLIPTVTEGAAGTVDASVRYQVLEGFGAAGCFNTNLLTSHTKKNEIYNVLFSQSGLDVFRVRNTYQYGSWYDISNDTAAMVSAAKSLNPNVKIMLCSWSPPASLKSNNNLRQGTLKKDAYGNYMYGDFAEWWYNSLVYYSGRGVNADYVSIQNEPDFETDGWETCRFNPTQNPDYAGYNLAFEAVYQELDSHLTELPKLIGPDAAGFYGLQSYVNTIINKDNIYGYCHHLYSGGGSSENPDGYIPYMTDFAATNGYKPLMQTEYAKDGDVSSFTDALNLAHLICNALVYEKVSVYVYWELFWSNYKGFVSIPYSYASTYTINPVYYAFKHYAWFTNPGWRRVAASTDYSNLRISAFVSPGNDELTVVIINPTIGSVSLTLTLEAFSPFSSEVYRSTSGSYWSYVGTFNPSMSLPAKSITTIHLAGETVFSTCSQVLSAGYGLRSDIHRDCYVDYDDIRVIPRYWLMTNCANYENCNRADLDIDNDVDLVDFSIFAQQWLQCNDPEDPNCTPTW